ncbi:hypothetical protein NHF46_08525 [Arthrobacter alpinus]|nr:hypothetical protein [Arthrobacter alpinus]
MFIGIGPKAEVESYLNGVHRTVITGVQTQPFRVSYSDVPGQGTPELPGKQIFGLRKRPEPVHSTSPWTCAVVLGSW